MINHFKQNHNKTKQNILSTNQSINPSYQSNTQALISPTFSNPPPTITKIYPTIHQLNYSSPLILRNDYNLVIVSNYLTIEQNTCILYSQQTTPPKTNNSSTPANKSTAFQTYNLISITKMIKHDMTYHQHQIHYSHQINLYQLIVLFDVDALLICRVGGRGGSGILGMISIRNRFILFVRLFILAIIRVISDAVFIVFCSEVSWIVCLCCS